jgi:hypothetical protein
MLSTTQIATIKAEISQLEEQLRVALNPHTMTPTEEKIYSQAKLHLGQHLTLNNAVPAEVGCCEACSYILRAAGVVVPPGGIAGTPALYEWFVANPEFQKIDEPEQGAIVIFVTGEGNGLVEGHVLIFGEFGIAYPGDWGLMSNESSTGNLEEQWCWQKALAYYQGVGGLVPQIFRAL